MRSVLLLLLAACGRLGFDSSGGGGDGGTEASVVGIADVCDVRTVGTLALDATATRVRAVALPSGFAVAIGTSANNVHIARVTADLSLASVHLPLQTTYTLGGIAALGDAVFVHAINAGTAYLKLLDPSWNAYTTIDDGDNAAADPPLAVRNAGTGMRVRISGGLATVGEIRADGTLTGVVSDYSAPAVFASLARAGDTTRVAVEAPSASCETYVVSSSGAATARHVRPQCRDPRVIGLPSGASVMAYSDGSTIIAYFIPTEGVAIGDEVSIAGARDVRIAAVDGAAWLLYQQVSAVEIKRIGTDLGATTTTVPITAPYDLLPEAAFWVDGQTLRVATPCLR